MEKQKKKSLMIIVSGAIFLLFAVTRLYCLDSLPEGLHYDEAGAAYDALCLSRFGVDRYLKSWPVYLINFGGGQNALYTWICAVLFKISGGYNIWLYRSVGVFFNFLVVVFCMTIAERIYHDDLYCVFIAGILVTICPCFILMSRFGLESYLMVGASTVFLYLFLYAVETEKIGYYIGAGISGGLVLYTYALSYFILPFFLIGTLCYLLRVRRFRIRGWFAMAVPMGILAFPLILVQIINLFDLPEMQIGIFTITKLPFYRSSDLRGISLSAAANALKSIFIGDSLRYNSIPGIRNLYVITIPFFVIGFIHMLFVVLRDLHKRQYNGRAILVCWFFSCLILFSMIETNVNRVNGIFGVVVLMTVEGIWVAFKKCKGWLKYVVALCTGVIYLGGFLGFSRYYYSGEYMAENKPISYFDITVEEAIAFLEEHPALRGKGTWMAEQKVYYALSAEASPYDMAFEQGMEEEDTGYYYGSLGEIEEGYNYIVRDIFTEYAQELRDIGYLEEKYENYSLFYKNWQEELTSGAE